MADIIEDQEIDKDTIDKDAIQEQFSKHYHLLTEQSVSLKKSYVNKLNGTKSLKLAVCLSDNSIEVYELNNTSLNKVCRLSGHKKKVADVVFSPKEDNLVYSAAEDGILKLWDTRTSGSCVQEYKDPDDTLVRPFDSMDVSCNGRVLAAGSQVVQDDAYIVFWDQRQTAPLGGYWNSHTDDITQVRFHKDKSSILASGSNDGLINIFNIMETTEDDALLYSLNVENSVEKLSWLNENRVACITQSNDLQIWDTDSGDMIRSLDREKVAKGIRRSKPDDCYLVDTFTTVDGSHLLLAGSYADNGDCLRSAVLGDKKLQPSSNFTQNKQTVSCCWYQQEKDILVTAGESGIISVWAAGVAAENGHAPNKFTSKMNKLHVNRHKPY